MTVITRAAHCRAWPFLAWAAAGAGLGLGIAGILSIGVFVLPATGAAMAALIRWDGLAGTRAGPAGDLGPAEDGGQAGRCAPGGRRARGAGLLCGLGSIPGFIAYLNRGGPGTVCHQIPGGVDCAQLWSPWPFLAASLLLVAGGAALYWRRAGR